MIRALAVVLVLGVGSARGGEPRVQTSVFAVKGMTCALCGTAIERSLLEVEGVKRVVIDAKEERVTVEAESWVGADALRTAIAAAGGFEARPIPPVRGAG